MSDEKYIGDEQPITIDAVSVTGRMFRADPDVLEVRGWTGVGGAAELNTLATENRVATLRVPGEEPWSGVVIHISLTHCAMKPGRIDVALRMVAPGWLVCDDRAFNEPCARPGCGLVAGKHIWTRRGTVRVGPRCSGFMREVPDRAPDPLLRVRAAAGETDDDDEIGGAS